LDKSCHSGASSLKIERREKEPKRTLLTFHNTSGNWAFAESKIDFGFQKKNGREEISLDIL
jgi:hypothetical protein